jgi:hypothetical protein
MNKPSKEQRDWLNESHKVNVMPPLEEWCRNKQIQNYDSAVGAYVSAWESKLSEMPTIIPTGHGREILFSTIKERLPKVNKFGLITRQGFKATIENKLIHKLEMLGGSKLELRNCAIKIVDCQERDNFSSSLIMIDCWVGDFRFAPKSLNYFEMQRGGVDRIASPLPNQQNPFLGSVSIASSVKFSAATENAQAFRNLRHHLMAIHNLEAASVFHSAEMRTLYRQQNRLDKTFNLIYRGISDYGNSTVRPIILFFVFTLGNFLIFYFADGAAVPAGTADTGWQLLLQEQGRIGNAVRGATITLTQVVNPLGIFGLKSLVVAKTAILVATNALLCFGATVSLAFFVFALRRRFRLT